MENNEKKLRTKQIGFPVTPDLVEAIAEVKRKTGISLAHLGREAIWKEISQIRSNHPAYASTREATV